MSAKSKGSSRSKRPASGKKTPKKEEIEDPTITQLRITNEDLQKQNAALQESLDHYQNKLEGIIQHIIGVSFDNYKPPDGLSLVDVPEQDITRLITNFTITPFDMINSCEQRLEDLETRLTQLTNELAKLLNLKLKLEKGLQDMQAMHSVEDLKVNAKRMWYDSCSTQIFVTLEETERLTSLNDITQSPPSNMTSRPSTVDFDHTRNNGGKEVIPMEYLSILGPKARNVRLTPVSSEMGDLEPPQNKMPGDTHIFDMHPELRSLIIRELSKQKGNGNDWRVMATRVGIPDSFIEQWMKMRVPNAMALVMRVWGDSPAATVRMLHRHLVSPQMKAIVLAKRISDFYDVD